MSASTRFSETISNKNFKVIHNCPCWLPRTQTWLYNQIRYLPDSIENHIFCKRTVHLDEFYLPNIHSFDRIPKGQFFLDRILRKLKFRHHLEFYIRVAKREKATL